MLTEEDKVYIQFLDWYEFFKNVYDIVRLEFRKNEFIKVPLNGDYLQFYRQQLEEMQWYESFIDRDAVKGVTNPIAKYRRWLLLCNSLWMIYYKGVTNETITIDDMAEFGEAIDELEEQKNYMWSEKFRTNLFKKLNETRKIDR